MSAENEERIEKIPVINWLATLLKKIKLPAFEGLSAYDLIEMYIVGIFEGALSTRASSIAFSLFLALFPLLIFMVTLVPFIIDFFSLENTNFDQEFPRFLESFLPTATGDYFEGIFQQIKDQKRGGLLSSSFLLMANGVNSIFSGFETSYHVKLTRNFFKQYAYALMVGLILSILIIVGFVAFIYFQVYVLGYLSEFAANTGGYVLEEGEILGVQIGKVLFFMILSYFTTAILYYFGTREGKQAKFFSAGALMTALLFLLTSYLFGVYIEKFARYNELYGALGGLLILMVYIWLNSNILLLGFELNATLTRLRKNLKNR